MTMLNITASPGVVVTFGNGPGAPEPVGERPPGLRWGPYGVAIVALTLAEAEASYDALVARYTEQRAELGGGDQVAYSRPYQNGDTVMIDIYSWGP